MVELTITVPDTLAHQIRVTGVWFGTIMKKLCLVFAQKRQNRRQIR